MNESSQGSSPSHLHGFHPKLTTEEAELLEEALSKAADEIDLIMVAVDQARHHRKEQQNEHSCHAAISSIETETSDNTAIDHPKVEIAENEDPRYQVQHGQCDWSGIDTQSESSEQSEALVPSEVIRKLCSSLPSERSSGLDDIVKLKGAHSLPYIVSSFDDEAPEVLNAAARALFALHSDGTESFRRVMREGSPERRRRIGSSLATSGLAAAAIDKLSASSREELYQAFSLLFLMAKTGEVQPLIRTIQEYPNLESRLAAVKLLSLCGQPDILPAFRSLAVRGSLPSEVRSAVMQAVYEISRQNARDLH